MNTSASRDSLQTSTSLDAASFPQTAKFMAWYQERKAAGLQDIKFYVGNLSDSTLESVFTEINSALSADSVPDNRPL